MSLGNIEQYHKGGHIQIGDIAAMWDLKKTWFKAT